MFNNSRYNEGQHKQSTSSSSQPWKNQDYNSVQGPPQQSTGYGERHYQFQYPQHQQVTNGIYHIPNHQRGWGKRAHEYVASASSSATSSMSKSQRKTSPTKSSQQSQLNRHKSLESSNPFQGQKNKQQSYTSTQRPQQHLQSPQKKKNPESHTKYLQNYKDKQWTELFTKALKELTFCESGKEVNVLLTFLQPSRSSWIKIKDQIYNDLLRLLKPLNVEKLLVFGSTLTGLDFVGSDLDYHVQLKCPPIESDDVKDIVNKTAKLTRNYQNQEFRVIYTITSARVPIIRLLHQRTKITCDINFTSQFGYYNSCFIGNVLCYDCRIKDLAVILKLWSKSHKIAEKMIISNYCLIMLMIFYLQNLEHPMLDTIKKNQESREPRVLDPKYKWNFYFNDSINKAQENQLSTRQLLVGFFEFYHKMNFDRYVVSLYNGDLILRQEFDTHPDLKLYRETVEESKLTPIKLDDAQTFIVQDGFELNLNIGIKCKKNVLVFFELIKASFAKCTELNAEPFSTLLMKLFTDIKLPESSQNSAKTKKKFLIKVHSIAGDLKVILIILFFFIFSTIFVLSAVSRYSLYSGQG